MKNLFPILLFLFLSSCSASKIISVVTEGEAVPNEFTQQMNVEYAEKHLFIDITIDGESHTFLFDTGYEISIIDKSLLDKLDFQPIKKNKTSGSSFETQPIQYGFLASLAIQDISFQHIGVGIQDLSFIDSPFSDKRKIAGIIGTNILRKASWQINYQDSTIRFSDKLADLAISPQAIVIQMTPRNKTGWGYNRIELDLNGNKESFIFDTGSSGSFTGNFALLDRLPSYESIPEGKDTIISIDKLVLGEIQLENVPLSIEKGVALLIGNRFWEDFLVTIDWKNNQLYLLPASK